MSLPTSTALSTKHRYTEPCSITKMSRSVIPGGCCMHILHAICFIITAGEQKYSRNILMPSHLYPEVGNSIRLWSGNGISYFVKCPLRRRGKAVWEYNSPKQHCIRPHGSLVRYVKLRVAHEPGMPGSLTRGGEKTFSVFPAQPAISYIW